MGEDESGGNGGISRGPVSSSFSMFSDFVGKTGYDPVQNNYTRVCITYRGRGISTKSIEWSIQVD